MVEPRRLVVAMLLSFAFVALAARAAPAPIQSIPVDVTVPFAPTPIFAEGERHLLYELHLTNMGSTPLMLESVVALDGRTHAVLAIYSGKSLASVLARPGAPGSGDKRVIAAGLRAVVFIDVIGPAAKAPAAILVHRLAFASTTPADSSTAQTAVDGAPVRVRNASQMALGPPLKGGGWIASHALSNASSHRRTLITLNGHTQIAQRFAIDWIRIGGDGQAFRNDPANNANWSAYGAEVLAVSDGHVTEVADNIPENDPTTESKAIPITFDNATGNHVILDIGGGRSVLYAHLQPHSLRVQVGERVARGQVLALLGNSGKSDAPHLHFQLMEGSSPLASEGLPPAFAGFDVVGHVPSLSVLANGTGWHATEPLSHRRNEMPVENAVVRFPD